MQKNFFRKGLVFGLIVISIVTSVSASVGQYQTDQKKSIYFEFKKTFSEPRNLFFQHTNQAQVTGEGYDLLIIAPNVFSAELKKLVNHKNKVGIATILIKTEEIYQTYTGLDKAEQIKYCIKDAYDQWGIRYVLLVGGLKGYFKSPDNEDNWYVPVRYSNLDLDGYPEPKYLSDLYFADIYWENTTDFCDWNSNEPSKGVFGEWRFEEGQEIKDLRDLVPEVSIGRLPCRNLWEVHIMVKKITTYESSNHTDKEWFLRFLMLGGENSNDTSPGYNGVIEGKYANQMAFDWVIKRYLFKGVGLWPSEEDVTKTALTRDYFVTEQNKGSGFTYLSGHGNPGSWFAHQYYTGFYNWTFLYIFALLSLRNRDKLPVAVIGGCNTACFDKPLREATTYLSIDSFSWIYTRWGFGGSIATVACTNVGYSLPGKNFTTSYGGYMQTHFFEIYGNGSDFLGDIWKQEITDYVHLFNATEDMLHCKIAESWLVLGDPSLKIGGY